VGPEAVGLNVLKERKSFAPAGIRTHGGGLLLSRRSQYIHHSGKLWTWVAQPSITLSPPSLVILAAVAYFVHLLCSVKVRPHRTRSAAADCGLCPLRNVTF